MKTLPQLLHSLAEKNVTLRLHGENLAYSSPSNVLQRDTLADLRHHRTELVRLLSDPMGLTLSGEALAAFQERMGVADDQAMPTHHGGPAWLTAWATALEVRPEKPNPLDDPERASTLAALVASKQKPKLDYRPKRKW